MRRGNAVLSVTLANEARADEISELLEECGAVDVDERAEQWKASGYVPPVSAATMPRDGGDDVLKLVEEELKGFLARRARSGQDKDIEIRETSEEPVVCRGRRPGWSRRSAWASSRPSGPRPSVTRCAAPRPMSRALVMTNPWTNPCLAFRALSVGRASAGVERRASA